MPPVPSAAPQHLSCRAMSPSTLLVEWAPPPPPFTHGRITNYKLSYQKVARNGVFFLEGKINFELFFCANIETFLRKKNC